MTDRQALERLMARVETALAAHLSEVEEQELATHLRECEACAREIQRVKQLRSLLQSSCSSRAPETLRERVRVTYREVHVQVRHLEN